MLPHQLNTSFFVKKEEARKEWMKIFKSFTEKAGEKRKIEYEKRLNEEIEYIQSKIGDVNEESIVKERNKLSAFKNKLQIDFTLNAQTFIRKDLSNLANLEKKIAEQKKKIEKLQSYLDIKNTKDEKEKERRIKELALMNMEPIKFKQLNKIKRICQINL